MSKKRTYHFEPVPDERALDYLPDGTRLEWVPTWEGVLQWAPEDLKNDRNIRIWHVFRSKNYGGKRVRIELSPSLPVYQGRQSLKRRAEFKFEHKGQLIHIYRSHLTMLCLTGFAIADRRHWVVDHQNEITLDDRPSNLQVISQRENSARSKRLQRIMRLSPAERMRQRLKRQAKMQERKLQLMAIHPDADMIDIELELAIEMQEWDYGKI